MGPEINLNGSKIGGNARVLNNAAIKNNDTHIELQNSEIYGKAIVLENLEIAPVLEGLKQKVKSMNQNSKEYSEIQNILGVQRWSKREFIKCITKHLGEFSQGVLASVVANLLKP